MNHPRSPTSNHTNSFLHIHDPIRWMEGWKAATSPDPGRQALTCFDGLAEILLRILGRHLRKCSVLDLELGARQCPPGCPTSRGSTKKSVVITDQGARGRQAGGRVRTARRDGFRKIPPRACQRHINNLPTSLPLTLALPTTRSVYFCTVWTAACHEKHSRRRVHELRTAAESVVPSRHPSLGDCRVDKAKPPPYRRIDLTPLISTDITPTIGAGEFPPRP